MTRVNQILVLSLCLVLSESAFSATVSHKTQQNAVPAASTVSHIQFGKLPDVSEDQNLRVTVLETKVNDLSNALVEQTGIFSTIILVILAIVGFITYRGLRTEFNEKVDALKSQLKQDDERNQAALLKNMDELSARLIVEDNNRDKLLNEKLTGETQKLSDRIHEALSNVYRAFAYALEENNPAPAAIWMLRSVQSDHRARKTIPVDERYMKARLEEVFGYFIRVENFDEIESFLDETIKIFDVLNIYKELSETLTRIRVELNRIQSLQHTEAQQPAKDEGK